MAGEGVFRQMNSTSQAGKREGIAEILGRSVHKSREQLGIARILVADFDGRRPHDRSLRTPEFQRSPGIGIC
jgi:hypothetical protein